MDVSLHIPLFNPLATTMPIIDQTERGLEADRPGRGSCSKTDFMGEI